MSKCDFSKIVDFTYENCEQVDVKDQIIYCRCPICGDSTTKKTVKRFRISYYPVYDEYMCVCWRCGYNKNIYSLYSELCNTSYRESIKVLSNRDFKKIKSQFVKKPIITIEEKPKHSILDINFNDCYSITDNPKSIIGKRYVNILKDFITSRKIPINCYIAYKGEYKNRIIIPIYINNELVYFQGRSIDNSIEPKYKNPSVDKENIIPNIDKFDKSNNIIITEGYLDSLMIEYNAGTCILGASLNDSFITKVKNKTDKNIIICLDNIRIDEGARNGLERFFKNSKTYKELKYFIPPKIYKYKDLNELRKNSDINIYDFVSENCYSYFYLKSLLKMI